MQSAGTFGDYPEGARVHEATNSAVAALVLYLALVGTVVLHDAVSNSHHGRGFDRLLRLAT